MKEKRNIQELIVREEPHLNNLLDKGQVEKFKAMTSELRDTWTKKQMFRTKTEMEFSVLNDARFPTNGAKYWQCVREQNSHMEGLLHCSFEYRKNAIELKKLEKKLAAEEDELEIDLIQVEIDVKTYTIANFQLQAAHRMREITEWSHFKKIYNDGSFDDKDVDTHQLFSYQKTMRNRQKTLTPGSSQAEVFNAVGQLNTIDRIVKQRKVIKHKKKKTLGKK